MPNPSTATVTAGPVLDFFGGAPAALTVEVVPVLGDTASHLVHAESGTAMAAYRRSFESDPVTGAVSFTLPHVDAPGWLDETGRTVTFWKYTARVTAVFDGDKTRRLSWRKEIQPLTGQASIDLELVPNGQTAEQFVTPGARVTSVNGMTGAIVIPEGPRGPAGPAGPTGPTGATGPTGPAGQPTAFELRGTGMPNGVVTASPGTYYTDTAGTAGAWRWLKTSGTGNTGWTVFYGDTGWRDITAVLDPANYTALTIQVRRAGADVMFRFKDLVKVGTSTTIGPVLAAGFRPDMQIFYTAFNKAVAPVGYYGQLNTDGNGYFTNSNPNQAYATAVFTTKNAWPSTLPGSPA